MTLRRETCWKDFDFIVRKEIRSRAVLLTTILLRGPNLKITLPQACRSKNVNSREREVLTLKVEGNKGSENNTIILQVKQNEAQKGKVTYPRLTSSQRLRT